MVLGKARDGRYYQCWACNARLKGGYRGECLFDAKLAVRGVAMMALERVVAVDEGGGPGPWYETL